MKRTGPVDRHRTHTDRPYPDRATYELGWLALRTVRNISGNISATLAGTCTELLCEALSLVVVQTLYGPRNDKHHLAWIERLRCSRGAELNEAHSSIGNALNPVCASQKPVRES